MLRWYDFIDWPRTIFLFCGLIMGIFALKNGDLLAGAVLWGAVWLGGDRG